MKQQLLHHKGYTGSVDHDLDNDVLYGKVLFVRDLVTFEAETISDLKAAFREAVDDYLEDCHAEGKTPDQPFSGTFNVRVGPTRHKLLAQLAARHDCKLNEVVCKAIDAFARHDGMPREVTNIHHHHFTLAQSSETATQAETGEWVMVDPIFKAVGIHRTEH